jgi:ABC-type Fe3+/spermidine/putrescine transport system ATPase subunit
VSSTVDSKSVEVRLEDLRRSYGPVHALDGLSLTLSPGELVALLGPSGCGKTTALRILAGLDEPTSGRVVVGGKDLTSVPANKRDMGMVFQAYSLFPHLTSQANVEFGLKLRGVDPGRRRTRALEMLELVGLADFADRYASQLSGGQQQRVALARALVNRPRVLLLDEPLGALDLKLRKEMQLELKRIQSEMKITFVHVTHDQEEAMTMADSIIVMNSGHIEQAGRPAELYERPKTAFVAGFLGVSNLLPGTVEGKDAVRLEGGQMLRVAPERLDGHTGSVSVGIRPEKLRIGESEANTLAGEIVESAYVGVSTQYVVRTPVGEVSVYVQGAGSQAPGDRIELSFAPESTFVVSRTQEGYIG